MLLIFLTPLGYQSPQNLYYYTEYFPQFQTSWQKDQPNLFMSNIASPYQDYRITQNQHIKIAVIATSQDYFEIFLSYVQLQILDYQTFYPIILNEQATQEEFFSQLLQHQIDQFDYVLMPFVLQYEELKPQQVLKVSLQQDKNKSRQSVEYQTIKQIQLSFKGYSAAMKINTTQLSQQYDDFIQIIINTSKTILVTNSIDTTNSLYISSTQICFTTPNGRILGHSSTCQFSTPIGFNTQGLYGKGNIGESIAIALPMLLSLQINDRTFCEKQFIIQQTALIKNQAISQRNRQYHDGFGYGVIDYNSIDQINALYYNKKIETQLSILLKGNIQNGQILSLGCYQVVKVYVTIRGTFDNFDETYENIPMTNIDQDNNIDSQQYNGISVWIAILDGNHWSPFYIGKLETISQYGQVPLNYILQQPNLNNFYLNNNIKIWFSYQQNPKEVCREINSNNNTLNFDMRVSLAIYGVQKNVSFLIVNQYQDVYLYNYLYFTSNVSFHYMVCYNELSFSYYTLVIEYENQIQKVMLTQLGRCQIVFCEEEQKGNRLILQSPYCATSHYINVHNYVESVVLATISYIIVLFVLVIVLSVFLYEKVHQE